MLKLDAEKDIGENPLLAGEAASKPRSDAAPDGAAEDQDSDMAPAQPELDYEQQVRGRTAPRPCLPRPGGLGPDA